MANVITPAELEQMRRLSLDEKVRITETKVAEWWRHWEGNVYVAFSGGKDSTVLLHIVREILPDVPAVYYDVGMDYPEIRAFVKTFDNVEFVRPEMPFAAVIREKGYPVVSRRVAEQVKLLKNAKTARTRFRLAVGDKGLKGPYILPKRWRYLLNAPFKISDECCYYLKKTPAKRYEKATGRKPIIATMADESRHRMAGYLRSGCNAFKSGLSRPMSFWRTEDVWDYIRREKIRYCPIYDMGSGRTGCIYCGFGCYPGGADERRFERLSHTHPKLWRYCMEKLGMRDVLQFIGVRYLDGASAAPTPGGDANAKRDANMAG